MQTDPPPLTQCSPFVAGLLSLLVPGLGQLYNREWAKGMAVLCIAAGLGGGMLMATVGPERSRSWLTAVMLGLVYLCIWIPAVVDAAQRAAGTSQPLLSGGKAWYIVLMLLSVGPMALPLLWQSPRFSRTAKIVWTAVVIVVALAAILFMIVVGPAVEQLLKPMPGLRPSLP